jgi:hypothetical protein
VVRQNTGDSSPALSPAAVAASRRASQQKADAARPRPNPIPRKPQPVAKPKPKPKPKTPVKTGGSGVGLVAGAAGVNAINGTPTTTQPALSALDAAEMAQNYGFALSFLNSDPELKKIFNQAVYGNGKDDMGSWSTAKFVAAIRNTQWYQKHAESWRQADLLQKSDPQTYNAKIAALTAQLSDRAAALGAPMSWAQLQTMAGNALHLGWNDAQINDQMAGYVKAVNGVYNGSVGDDVGSLRNVAWRNGVNLSDVTLQSYAQQIAKGSASRSYFERQIRQMAKTAAPGYTDQLDAGMDLYDISDPYRQSMAKILELNPTDIDLFDPTIRSALTAVGQDGKPTSKSLWQFENDLRKDPRWLSTSNARSAGMSVAHKVLQDFGFSY